ncbi:MAG: heavy metal translocating P-type ATPase [Desulfitobacteriia bacterium]|jgi:Cd2+/Zn2+-exporting ATPase
MAEIKVLKLEGLDCANCAAEIEKQINKLEGVSSVRLDLLPGKLIIEALDKKKLLKITDRVPQIINSIEHGVKVIDPEKERPSQDSRDRKSIVFFTIGVVAFLGALIPNSPLGLKVTLFLGAYLLIGWPVIFRALRNLVQGRIFDENFLMFIATVAAFSIREFPEAVAVMLFYRIGIYFQKRAVDRSRRSITSLMNIRPDYANLETGDEVVRVSPEEVEIGQNILVQPGERVPLDGVVIKGSSFLDTSALTGEFVPRKTGIGDQVLAGFINQNGLLTVKVTKSYEESTVAGILKMVEEASSRKAPAENFITKFARYYTPIVVLAAAMLAIIPTLFLEGAIFSDWLYRALVFLVVSCPCALVISIPLSFFGGIGGASRQGILIKGGNYLEALNSVRALVFDKTGTLTEGVFEVTNILPVGGISEQELLKFAALAEKHSNHPIAVSIRKKYGEDWGEYEVRDYQEISGYGVKATVDNKIVLAGNHKLLAREGIAVEKKAVRGTVVYVAVEGQYMGCISISDKVRKDTAKALKNLKQAGIQKIIMLTGDNKTVSESLGKELGFDEVYAELLPHEKVKIFERIEREKKPQTKIGFVGDGINDAPVLARADIGIAMGGLGTDAAIEAADIVLMTDEPSKLSTAFRIAGLTRKIVWQNIVFALGVKFAVLLLGALGMASMWEAVFADVGVAILAILNAMRVLSSSPKLSS